MESVVVDASEPACPWVFLPTDLLLDVSGRLHDARDFVRFHAVCRRWRDAALAAARHKFFPWMLSQHPGRGVLMHIPVFYSGSVTSEAISSYHRCYGGNVLQSLDDTAWVAGPNGEAVWRFDWHPKPTLHDIVTGAICPLPPFADDNYGIEQQMGKPHGVIYSDGTVFLYSFDGLNIDITVFMAAILSPGDTAWMIMEKRLFGLATYDNNYAAYYDGKVLVWMGRDFYCFMTKDLANNDGDIDGIRLEMVEDRSEHKRHICYSNHVFESHGKLLWASVILKNEWLDKKMYALSTNVLMQVPALAVMVHAAEEEVDGCKIKMRWVERDGRSLGDHILFLGFPTSFAADSAQLNMDGGCAYFVFLHQMLKYNFITGKTKRVESPRTGWISPDAHLWLRPQPVIAPIEEIRKRLGIRPNRKEDQKEQMCAIQ